MHSAIPSVEMMEHATNMVPATGEALVEQYTPIKKNNVSGLLWVLRSIIDKRPGSSGSERRGTVLFVVLDYLTEEGRRGDFKHLYHHDLESFMWVFAWIVLRWLQEGSPPTSGITPLQWLGNFGCCNMQEEEVLLVKFLENFHTLGYRPTHMGSHCGLFCGA